MFPVPIKTHDIAHERIKLLKINLRSLMTTDTLQQNTLDLSLTCVKRAKHF
jgi:hypothetical protein